MGRVWKLPIWSAMWLARSQGGELGVADEVRPGGLGDDHARALGQSATG
jgi:hypothetical protein